MSAAFRRSAALFRAPGARLRDSSALPCLFGRGSRASAARSSDRVAGVAVEVEDLVVGADGDAGLEGVLPLAALGTRGLRLRRRRCRRRLVRRRARRTRWRRRGGRLRWRRWRRRLGRRRGWWWRRRGRRGRGRSADDAGIIDAGALRVVEDHAGEAERKAGALGVEPLGPARAVVRIRDAALPFGVGCFALGAGDDACIMQLAPSMAGRTRVRKRHAGPGRLPLRLHLPGRTSGGASFDGGIPSERARTDAAVLRLAPHEIPRARAIHGRRARSRRRRRRCSRSLRERERRRRNHGEDGATGETRKSTHLPRHYSGGARPTRSVYDACDRSVSVTQTLVPMIAFAATFREINARIKIMPRR